MNLNPKSFSLIRNFLVCANEAMVDRISDKTDFLDRKNSANHMSGKVRPNKKKLLNNRILPPQYSKLLDESFVCGTASNPNNLDLMNFLFLPQMQQGCFKYQATFYPFFACYVEAQYMQKIAKPENKLLDKSLLPEPYKAHLSKWLSCDKNDQTAHETEAYLFRLHSLILFLAIREAGCKPQQRFISQAIKWHYDDADTNEPKSFKSSFFRMGDSVRYTLWKAIATNKFKTKYGEQTPTDADLNIACDKGTFYKKLDQPRFDEYFLVDVLITYFDHYMALSEDANEKVRGVSDLIETVKCLHTLDCLHKQQPDDVNPELIKELINLLDPYISFTQNIRQLPEIPLMITIVESFISDFLSGQNTQSN